MSHIPNEFSCDLHSVSLVCLIFSYSKFFKADPKTTNVPLTIGYAGKPLLQSNDLTRQSFCFPMQQRQILGELMTFPP